MEQRRPLLLEALNRLYAAREGRPATPELVGVGEVSSADRKEDR
jgi:hypothetical protein